jgi:hypothetical protein
VNLAGDEDVLRFELEEAGRARGAERFRRRHEVDRLDEIRLPLAVAADEDVDRWMEFDNVGCEVPKILGVELQ